MHLRTLATSRIAIAIGGTLLIGTATSVAAAGTWQFPATDVSAPGQNALGPKIATDPSGAATAVWVQGPAGSDSTIQASRGINGAWGAPGSISTPAAGVQADQPQIAVDPSGVVTAVWDVSDRRTITVQAARYSNGSWSPPVNLSASGATAVAPAVVVDRTGVVTAAWSNETGSRRSIVVSRFADGAWSSPQTISRDGTDATSVQLAVGPSGSVTAVWSSVGKFHSTILASRSAKGGWSRPRPVSDPRRNADAAHVVIDAKGVATVVWSADDGAYSRIWAARARGGACVARTRSQPRGATRAIRRLQSTHPGS